MRFHPALAAAAVLSLSTGAFAAIIGPYGVDANTLHLYHLNDSAIPPVVDSATTPLNLAGPTANTGSAGGFTLPTTGASAFTGFGTALDFSAGSVDTNAIHHRPVVTGNTTLTTTDDATIETVPFSFSSTPAAGAGGAFTMEALVKFDASFNPTTTNFRNGASGSVGGNYPMEIISGEGDTNAGRNWQFRINQIGAGTGSAANGTTRPRVEFANLHGIVSNQSIAMDIPLTGASALTAADVAAGTWYHVAVTYNGLESTAGNLSFYWTKMDPGNAYDNLIGTAQMNFDLTATATTFALGNEGRDAGSGVGEGESFVGSIDEVRISDIARGNQQMQFIPEPTTLAALAGAAVVALRRRSK